MLLHKNQVQFMILYVVSTWLNIEKALWHKSVVCSTCRIDSKNPSYTLGGGQLTGKIRRLFNPKPPATVHVRPTCNDLRGVKTFRRHSSCPVCLVYVFSVVCSIFSPSPSPEPPLTWRIAAHLSQLRSPPSLRSALENVLVSTALESRGVPCGVLWRTLLLFLLLLLGISRTLICLHSNLNMKIIRTVFELSNFKNKKHFKIWP